MSTTNPIPLPVSEQMTTVPPPHCQPHPDTPHDGSHVPLSSASDFINSFCVVSHVCSLLVCVSVVSLFYFLIGELAPLLSVLGTKCISATNPRRAESPDLDPVAMHYLVLFLISFCSVSASSQLVKPS